MSPDVVLSGHLCADLLPETSSLPLEGLASPGKLFEVGALTIATGGAVSNVGTALYKLGVDIRMMTTVGDDLLGRVIIAKLRDLDEALGDFIHTRENTASSYSVILSPQNSDRIILHCTGNNEQFDTTDIDFEVAAQAKLFHLGYPPLLPRLYANGGASLRDIYAQMHDAGVITSLDMAHPDPKGASGQVDWRTVLDNALPYVDIFLPSIEEIAFMLRRDDYDRWQGRVLSNISRSYLHDLADELLAMGVTIAGFKLGEYGVYLRSGDDVERLARLGLPVDAWRELDLYQPALKANVVGTIGAGDAAYAGFLAALLRGFDPLETLRMMCAVGACAVEAQDTSSGIQSWEATRDRLHAGWEPMSQRLE